MEKLKFPANPNLYNSGDRHSNDPESTADGCTELLLKGAQEGLLDLVQDAVESGVSLAAVNAEGKTALQLATESGHEDVVAFLSSRGADGQQETLFWTAVESGHVDTVQYLLEEGAEVDQINARGATALSVAAQQGHTDMVALLLKAGANFRHTDAEGHPALIRAAQKGHVAVVRLFLAAVPDEGTEQSPLAAAEAGEVEVLLRLVCAKAAVNRANRDGRTPLFAACENGHLAVALLLVGVGAVVPGSGLHIAAQNGHTKVARLLVSAQVDVDCIDKKGRTPLHIAAENGHTEMVQLLVSAKAAVDRAYADGRTPLHIAARNCNVEVAQLLVSAEAAVDCIDESSCTPLHIAVEVCDAEMVRLLVSARGARAAVDCMDEKGRTPLHIAARNCNVEVAQLLVSAEAAVDCIDKSSCTPLHIAVEVCDAEMVRLLVSARGARAAVDCMDEKGRTPLHIAARNCNVEVAQLLVSAEALVNCADENDRTPLHIAAENGHTEMAQLLVLAKAGVDNADERGRTPLFVACRGGHQAVSALLVRAGAAVNAARNDGCTPLYIAAQNGHVDVARLLVGARAAADKPMSNGWTPLHIAAHNGHAEVVQLLMSALPPSGEGPPPPPGRPAPPSPPPAPPRLEMPPLFSHIELPPERPEPPQAELHCCWALLSPSPPPSPSAAGEHVGQDTLPLYFACWYGNLTVAALLVGAGAVVDEAEGGRTPLYAAAHNGHTQVARLLVTARAAVDQADEDGGTPLWVACFYGHLELAKFLVKSQADANHPNNDGLTPLFVAAQEGRHLVLEWLLTVGADLTAVDSKGCSPLWAAVQYQHPDCVGELLKAKADANFINSLNGQTVLMCAAATGDTASIEWLRSSGAKSDATVRDHRGFTTFYHSDYTVEAGFAPQRLEELLQLSSSAEEQLGEVSVEEGKTSKKEVEEDRREWLVTLEKVLQDPDVNVNAGDKYLHWTPLMEAVLFGSEAAVRCLMEHGAEPAVPMFCGLTAAFWAALRGSVAIQAALGAGAALSAAETAGLAAVRRARQQSQAAEELLAFDGGGGACQGTRRWADRRRIAADLSVQLRMADVATVTAARRFYPKGYRCPVSLHGFLAAIVQRHKEGPKRKKEGGPPHGNLRLPTHLSDQEVSTLGHMALEGRKMAAVHVAAPNEDLRQQEATCALEDVFALFCYSYESVAYRRSNEAMRDWNRRELRRWRPFIHHCEQALRWLPPVERVVYRGIPISFEDKFALGHSFVWQSFSSTSELLKVAMNFALRQDETPALIFVIKGRSGVSIRHCSHYPAEAEILFPPNMRLTTKWLGRKSVLGVTETLRELPQWVGKSGYAYLLKPHQLTTEQAKVAKVVVVYCEEEVEEEGEKGGEGDEELEEEDDMEEEEEEEEETKEEEENEEESGLKEENAEEEQ